MKSWAWERREARELFRRHPWLRSVSHALRILRLRRGQVGWRFRRNLSDPRPPAWTREERIARHINALRPAPVLSIVGRDSLGNAVREWSYWQTVEWRQDGDILTVKFEREGIFRTVQLRFSDLRRDESRS